MIPWEKSSEIPRNKTEHKKSLSTKGTVSMKRTVSLLLAALMIASAFVSCGKTESAETSAPETKPVETSVTETLAPETDAPTLSFPTDKLTENGAALSAVVISANATETERLAAEDLVYHIKKVSGADAALVNTVAEDALSIVIGTPDTFPELAELFPEDMAWLSTLSEEDGRRWGDDGFAIRQKDGVIYIFGMNAKGAMNGTYDFIEENMGVIWTSAYEEVGLLYTEMPTIEITSVDYREKSPFHTRTWNLAGYKDYDDTRTFTLMNRNKMTDSPFQHSFAGHNLKYLVKTSPLYNPEITEYWNTDFEGKRLGADASPQVNFWSDLTIEAIAASLINIIETDNTRYVFVGIEDLAMGRNIPEDKEPFEYAPGQFVNPEDEDYITTVYYTFLNKIAAIVTEKYPDVTIGTFAYTFTEKPPRCEINPCILLEFAPIYEDITDSVDAREYDDNAAIYNNLEAWKEYTNNIYMYNYYGCYMVSLIYCRPIWDRIASDLRYYAESGFFGLQPEGFRDDGATHYYSSRIPYPLDEETGITTNHQGWLLNGLTFWIYHKLSWNPYEDVDALIVEYCDKVYGAASEHMQEYYRLLEEGWNNGRDAYIQYGDLIDTVLYSVMYNTEGLAAKMKEALDKAWEAADDTIKERLQFIVDTFEMNIEY